MTGRKDEEKRRGRKGKNEIRVDDAKKKKMKRNEGKKKQKKKNRGR